ncbi:copper resistance CopC family protein [Longispora albida]|uniref:copper resistance CopC family protein n=1 Tax=Longispora albida TaxID=203523 RepID=UPI0003A702A4|nr:copper resistance CopC family protein [Longispora albida]
MKRALVVSALAAAGVLAFAAPAAAHSSLNSTNPTDGATITTPISDVKLRFNEPVDGRFSTVAVNGPGGVSYSTGKLTVTDTEVSQPVKPLKAGKYDVAWRVVSADGHPISGTFTFTADVLAAPAAVPGDPEPSDGPVKPVKKEKEDSYAASGWLWWAAGGGALLAIGALVFVLLRGRSKVAA